MGDRAKKVGRWGMRPMCHGPLKHYSSSLIDWDSKMEMTCNARDPTDET